MSIGDGQAVTGEARSPQPRFYRMIPAAPAPARAQRHAAGNLPMRAQQRCDAATLASGFGWYFFPPMDFRAVYHGNQVLWSYGPQKKRLWIDTTKWHPLGVSQFPHFAAEFDRSAPPDLRGRSPYFVAGLPEPGVLQIWTGYFARCAPGWSLLIRAPANMPSQGDYAVFEGLIEADRYFSPVFLNIRLTGSGGVASFSQSKPLLQVQPIPRAAYASGATDFDFVESLAGVNAADWADYKAMVDRKEGAATYAVAARRRRKRED